MRFSIVAACCIVLMGCDRAHAVEPGGTHPNVLMIAIDDLRSELGCYGDAHIHSPNIDALAATGRRFERAYCQQAVCNPSRTSLMTGLRPDSIGVTGNHVHFRSKRPAVVTLSQHFIKHGYHAQSIGKIYHGVFPDGASKTSWDTMGDPPSWSVPTTRFGPRYYYTESGIAQAQQSYQAMYRPSDPRPNDGSQWGDWSQKDDWTQKLVFGPMTEAPEVDDETLYDGKVAAKAVESLRSFKNADKPFFLAVGFIKPHSPFVAPKRYWDLYDPAKIELATEVGLPDGAPAMAGHGSGEIRRYTDQPARGEIPEANRRQMKHGYFACISYVDAQIGKVLAALKSEGLEENTIVVLFSDHGYHLGEHGLWGKTTNFELDTRVPLVVRVPGITSPGQSTRRLAELVDLYPTIVDLAGLPLPSHLEGTSLAAAVVSPAMKNQEAGPDDVALSQYPRGGNADTGGKTMGYSLRTDRWRYTEWIACESGKAIARELYDHGDDDQIEKHNLAGDMQHASVLKDLSRRLRSLVGQVPNATSRDRQDEKQHAEKIVLQNQDATSTSFEECKAGEFTTVQTAVGRWSAEAGHAEIDDRHRRNGRQCLHLLGGESRVVELTLTSDLAGRSARSLTFHAERWTKRNPFSFRIEQRTDGGRWKEIYSGDDVIRIGGFLTKVTIPLDANATRLRFTSTSPERSGVLIDDLTFVPPTPQRIVDVTVDDVEVPVLVGLSHGQNPLLRIRIDTVGTLNPISLTSVESRLAGTITDRDLASVQLVSSRDSTSLGVTPIPFGQPASVKIGDQRFADTHELQHGSNYFWLSCTLSDQANIDHTITANCRKLGFSDGTTLDPTSERRLHRLGVAVRQQGQNGVHTCRIPGLATTNKGTLIAVYDLRHRSGGDLPGDIDVGMSRSADGGRTWGPMRAIMDMGDDPEWRYDGAGDPAVLVDRNTGTVWVAATWSHGNRSWFGSGPGIEPSETGQLMLVRSDDDGLTWSKPINITPQAKNPNWCFLLQGPGKGITMRDGTLVFAAQYQDPVDKNRLPHSTILYSQDHGATWRTGSGAFDDTTEAQVVEVQPGVLMLNCRYNRKPVRVVMTTSDMGKTWQQHSTSQRSLIEPSACMASLVDVDTEAGNDVGGWLLFSNPDSTRGRHHITIKASSDKGATWPKEHRLLLDEGSGRGYSCMSMIDASTVGILYEGSPAHMTFQRIPLAAVIGDPRQLASRSKQVDKKPTHEELKQEHLQLPQVFGNHMVLQAGAELPVWGRAKPTTKVTVTLGDQQRSTIADDEGEWQIRFPARKATATATELSVESEGERVRFADILIGEVWVCAGQSNMEFRLRDSDNAALELSAADHPHLRLLNLVGGARGSSGGYTREHLARLTPATFSAGEWEVSSPESASSFTAVGWYFGRYLQEQLNVPVGLICPAVGGTPTEAWIPREALQRDPTLSGLVAGNWLDNKRLGEFCRTRGEQNLLRALQAGEVIPGDDLGPNHSFKPGFMWEAGIAPLIPYAVRGAIWYQGESNAENRTRVLEHSRLFPLMVHQWRKHWGQGDFPILYVQLPSLNRPDWPLFRDQQRRLLDRLDHVGMAITIDTGHPTNVHPTLKKPVGERLAAWAMGTTYGSSADAVYAGPLLHVAETEGDSIVVQFDHVGGGLATNDNKPPGHFEVCGDDGVYYPGTAKIVGKNTVSVFSRRVSKPKHLRYAWIPYPDPPVNLFNSAGIPASPFSTTDQQQVTQADSDRPNILLIVGEDHGCELSCYGDPVIETPNIDRLATQGLLFENGYVTQSVCSPSRSTIFTGLYPHQNGQLGLATHQFGWFERWPTTYSLLKNAGYRTGLIGKTHVIPADAVESFVDFRFQESANFSKKQVANYAVKAGEFFRASDEPFFMTVNYPDAHWPLQGQVDGLPETQVDATKVQVMPYIGGETPRMRQVVQNYYDCMLRLDACVGGLLEQLDKSGKADNTLVVFIGDHGAQMARGKVTVYEGGMRVPFIARWPGVVSPGERSKALVSTIDLLPTFMQAAGVATPAGLPGQSLRAVFDGTSGDDFRQYLACERNCDAAHITFPQRTIRDARYKLIYSPVRDREDPAARYYRIHGATHWSGCLTDKELVGASDRTKAGYARWLNPPEVQLYDLQIDPHEWNDIADNPEYAKDRTRLQAAMKTWQLETNDPLRHAEKLQRLMEETDAVNADNRRSPKDGWKYLQYWHPTAAEESGSDHAVKQ